jgi:hypothetical protein
VVRPPSTTPTRALRNGRLACSCATHTIAINNHNASALPRHQIKHDHGLQYTLI